MKDDYTTNSHYLTYTLPFSTFTPKSDQDQISPAASPVILHHAVWRTWLFIAYSDWKMILVPVLTTSLIHFSWKGWENVLFELGSERVKLNNKNHTTRTFWTICFLAWFDVLLFANVITVLSCFCWGGVAARSDANSYSPATRSAAHAPEAPNTVPSVQSYDGKHPR